MFLTAVNPMDKDHKDPHELDLTKTTSASSKQKWKVHQDTVYRVDFQLAQRKGLKFSQTRSNAVILYDTLPACCISKAIVMKSEEIISESACVTSASSKDFLQRLLDERIGFTGCWKQQGLPTNPTKTKPNCQERGDSWVSNRSHHEIEKDVLQERGDLWMDQNPSRVVCQCLLNLQTNTWIKTKT